MGSPWVLVWRNADTYTLDRCEFTIANRIPAANYPECSVRYGMLAFGSVSVYRETVAAGTELNASIP
jgi:hypothetical protein